MTRTSTQQTGGVMGVMLGLIAVAALAGLIWLLATPAAVPAAPPPVAASVEAEVRGVWIAPDRGFPLAGASDVEATMRRVRDAGFNTVYLDVWRGGRGAWPSPRLLIAPPERDLLHDVLIEAHRQGLFVIASFVEPLTLSAELGVSKTHANLLAESIFSVPVSVNGRHWLNPAHPQIAERYRGMVRELLDRYDVDGVQFVGPLGWPVDAGYDEHTRAMYAAGNPDGDQPPTHPETQAWVQWRATMISGFYESLIQEIRQRRPSLLISVAGKAAPASTAADQCGWRDFAAWEMAATKAGVPASVVRTPDHSPNVQIRNRSFAVSEFSPCFGFAESQPWPESMETEFSRLGPQRTLLHMVPAVDIAPTPSADAAPVFSTLIEQARKRGLGGVVFACDWSAISTATRSVFPAPSGGDVAMMLHPQFPTRWRPSAGVATKARESWRLEQFDWTAIRRTTIIIDRGQGWEVASGSTAGGSRVREIPSVPAGVTRVEVLVDRREDFSRPRESPADQRGRMGRVIAVPTEKLPPEAILKPADPPPVPIGSP